MEKIARKRLVLLLYRVTTHVPGGAALDYRVAFLCSLCVPESIDSGEPGNAVVALCIEVGLIAQFGLQHSVMARSGFRARLTRRVPEAAERSTFMPVTRPLRRGR